MSKIEDRIIRKLEAQVERAQARLSPEPQRSSPIGFLGGLALGTVAGALLAFFFPRDQEELPANSAAANDEAIVLRERSSGSREQASAPRPLAAMPTAPEEVVTDQLAAAELESPQAVKEIDHEATSTDTKAATPAQASATKPADKPKAAHAPQAAQTPASATASTAQATEADTDKEQASAMPSGQAVPVDGVCPATHPIKGNKGSMGALIYHNQDSASYDRIHPEVCFATEQDAEAAGYRAPRG
jgi:outer membrane biosynthesis protein TonB